MRTPPRLHPIDKRSVDEDSTIKFIMDSHQDIVDQVSRCPPPCGIRTYRGGELTSRQRSEVSDASASESDRYEELFVNPDVRGQSIFRSYRKMSGY